MPVSGSICARGTATDRSALPQLRPTSYSHTVLSYQYHRLPLWTYYAPPRAKEACGRSLFQAIEIDQSDAILALGARTVSLPLASE